MLFFALLRDLGRSARTASACTAIFVVATTLWVYARYPYSEILQLAWEVPDEAYALLWTAPCDLAAAEPAVVAYQRAILEGDGRR